MLVKRAGLAKTLALIFLLLLHNFYFLLISFRRPSLNLMCGPSRISSMEFLRANMNTSKQQVRSYNTHSVNVLRGAMLKSSYHSTLQLLSVGDANGNLHIFDLPRNLWKPAVNEKVLIQQFFDREFKKVKKGLLRLMLNGFEGMFFMLWPFLFSGELYQ